MNNESKIISRLKNRLHHSKNSPSEVLNILSDLRHYVKQPNILKALNPEKQELAESVLAWAENSSDVSDYQNRDFVDKISLLKAREGKIRGVTKMCDSFLNDLPNYRSKREVLEQISKELHDESTKLFNEWCNGARSIRLDSTRQCIEIEASSQIPRVTFDPRLVKLSQDARVFRCLGFALPEEIIKIESDVKKYGIIARELREIVNFYCTVADQILLSQQPMLIDAAKAFTSLLETRDRMSWNGDAVKTKAWLEKLKQFAKSFSTENRELRRQHQKILSIMIGLFKLSPPNWRSLLNDINTILQTVDTKYQHTVSWKKHWDHQLYKVLEYHFNESLMKSNKIIEISSSDESLRDVVGTNGSKLEICFASETIAYRPPLEEVKARIYMKIKKFLQMTIQFKGFAPDSGNNDENKSLFYTIYLRNFTNLPLLYEKVDEIIDELMTIKNQFIEWISLYYLLKEANNNDINQVFALETLEDYKKSLMLIKSKAQKFHKDYFLNEIKCERSDIVINMMPLKTFVDWLLIETDKVLVFSLKNKILTKMKDINKQCDEVFEVLSKKPENISQLKDVNQLVKKDLMAVNEDLSKMGEELQVSTAFLSKWSSRVAPSSEETRQKLEEFQRIYETKDSLLDSYQDILKNRTESEINNIIEEVDIFKQTWQKNKELKEETKETINEKRIECEAIAAKCKELSERCKYFSIQVPDHIQKFEQLTEEIRDLDAKWNLISEFESGLSEYINMEWIVCRNKLSAIENYITNWQENNPNAGSILEKKISEWRDLLSLLKLSRGECFAKSHWVEFLAALGLESINDYDKLKLSHLLEVKSRLLASREIIKQLNIRAANELSIRETFNELDVFASSKTLTLFTHTTSQNVEIQLIKDWRTVLNQIAESMLTLQSLKNAEFFSADFAERAELWETKLNSLDLILGLLNSVQRKWIFLEPIYTRGVSGLVGDSSFATYSRQYIDIMSSISRDPHVMRLLHLNDIENRLKAIDQVLITCQKKLQSFMELSRSRFPRFYFLADDDLLLILAGKVDANQTALLKKLFNGTIVKLIVENKNTIIATESPEGEILELNKNVIIDSSQGATGVEMWLRLLENQIKETLKFDLFQALFQALSQSSKNINWKLPNQILSLHQHVLFTQKTEDALRSHSLSGLKEEYANQLSLLANEGKNSDKVLQIKMKFVILDTIHFLSVLEELIKNETRSVEDWTWQKQLRFYGSRAEKTLNVKMGCANLNYSFEYLGCFGGSKLVHTPLTDKCYLTLTQGKICHKYICK